MALVDDRVKETSSTTGIGDVTLAGSVAQFQSFNTAFGTNVNFYYAIIDGDGVDWETGEGYLSGTTTLVRNRVHHSTNSNNAIDLSANTHSVFSSAIGEMFHDMTGKTYVFSRNFLTL
jgi:hypothetical protein